MYEKYFGKLKEVERQIAVGYGYASNTLREKMYRTYLNNHPEALKHLILSESDKIGEGKDNDLHGAVSILTGHGTKPLPTHIYTDGNLKYGKDGDKNLNHHKQNNQPNPKPQITNKPSIILHQPKTPHEKMTDALNKNIADGTMKNVDVNKVVSGIHSDITGLSQTQKQSLSEEQKVKMGFSHKPPSMRRPIKPINKNPPQISPAHITMPVPIMDANVGEISGSSTI